MSLSSFGVSSPMTLKRREMRRKDENGLTGSDRELLVSLADGMTIAEFADYIGLQSVSVEAMRVRLFRKLNVKNAPHAVAWGFRNGYIK